MECTCRATLVATMHVRQTTWSMENIVHVYCNIHAWSCLPTAYSKSYSKRFTAVTQKKMHCTSNTVHAISCQHAPRARKDFEYNVYQLVLGHYNETPCRLPAWGFIIVSDCRNTIPWILCPNSVAWYAPTPSCICQYIWVMEEFEWSCQWQWKNALGKLAKVISTSVTVLYNGSLPSNEMMVRSGHKRNSYHAWNPLLLDTISNLQFSLHALCMIAG